MPTPIRLQAQRIDALAKLLKAELRYAEAAHAEAERRQADANDPLAKAMAKNDRRLQRDLICQIRPLARQLPEWPPQARDAA